MDVMTRHNLVATIRDGPSQIKNGYSRSAMPWTVLAAPNAADAALAVRVGSVVESRLGRWSLSC
jgi:hypothetical protein